MFLANRVGVSIGTVGTGTLTIGAALGAVAPNVSSYQSFAGGGILDQTESPYYLTDANGNWEFGTGTYTLSGTTFTRNVIGSNNSNAAINLSGSAQLFIMALATPGGDVLGGFPNPFRGFDTPINLQINATVGSNLLTVAIKDNKGNDPSVNSPIYIPFRDPTATGGDPIWRRVTSALSINTNAVGASLGSSNNTAFRFWVCAFDNAGTIVLGLINCSNATTIFPLNEGLVASTTAMSAGSTSAGVFYTPNGTTLTSKSFRILCYVEYNSTGLATAGTYSSAPNFIQLFGPSIKKPGDLVQMIGATTGSAVNFTSNVFASTNLTANITPTSAANLIESSWSGNTLAGVATSIVVLQMFRGSTAIGPGLGNQPPSGTNVQNSVSAAPLLDLPNTISSTTYVVKLRNTDNSSAVQFANQIGTISPSASMMLREIMG